MKEIVSYRRTLNRRLDRQWEWACPIWFGPGMFADAWITNRLPFKRKRDAVADMKRTMKKFGVTKKTECF